MLCSPSRLKGSKKPCYATRNVHPGNSCRKYGCEDGSDYSGCLLVWKFQRVAPYGSDVPKAKIVSGFTSYTCHGGGPALGALYLAVRPSLTTVGLHPSFLYISAIRFSRAGSPIFEAGSWNTRWKS